MTKTEWIILLFVVMGLMAVTSFGCTYRDYYQHGCCIDQSEHEEKDKK